MAQGSSQNSAVQVAAADSQPATIVAARAGYSIRVLGYVLAAFGGGTAWPDGAVGTVQWQDGAGNNLSGIMGLRESLPLVAPVGPQTETDRGGWFETAAGQALTLNVATCDAGGHVTWIYVSRS